MVCPTVLDGELSGKSSVLLNCLVQAALSASELPYHPAPRQPSGLGMWVPSLRETSLENSSPHLLSAYFLGCPVPSKNWKFLSIKD